MWRKISSFFVIFLVIGFLYYNNVFFIAEESFTDRITEETKQVESTIKILAIDDASLEEIGKWPWPRDIIANTAASLAENGATAVGIDVLYSEPSRNPEEDQIMQNVVNSHPSIFLPLNFVFDQKQNDLNGLSYKTINYPAIDVPDSQLVHINVFEDIDRVVRHVSLGIPNKDGEIIPAFGVKMANMQLQNEGQSITWNRTGEFFKNGEKIETINRNQVAFTYSTEPSDNAQEVLQKKFDVIPIYKVINGEYDPLYFENSIVFIGPYSVGMGDAYHTPMSQTTKMFGVEIHANIMQSLVDDTYYHELPVSYGLVLLGLMTLLSFFTIDRFSAKWGFLISLAFTVLYTFAVKILFDASQTLIPYVYMILAFIAAYVTSVVSQYIIERKEKSRVTGLFGRYVSKGVVDEILSNEEEVKLGGVRKEVSLVFVDIRGFTTLSETMEPEEVILILNEYLDLCTKAVFEFDGTLDKFIGDGVMAIFGAPIEQKDHAIRATKAALRMKEKATDLAKHLEEKYGRGVSFGIGINSGPAVIGNIGSHDRLDYTAIGDTVNLAARLESNAKPGQVLISEATYGKIKDHFVITPLEMIKVKGKEKPVMIYQVEEER